jgi:hypothetical protein
VRVLFSLAYPGYLRYYDSVIRELASREHEVILVFDVVRKQEEGLATLESLGPTVRNAGTLPRRIDMWQETLKDVRRAADAARYFHPRFAASRYLRSRATERLPLVLRPFKGRTLPAAASDALVRFFLALEDAVPGSSVIHAFIDEMKPDVVVGSPLVMLGARQNDLVVAAREQGIPVVAAIASWDHLTTKGMLRKHAQRVVVWNEQQRREAVELHGIDPDTISVTGAQPFDRWFERTPTRDRSSFLSEVGLPADRPFVLFVGSTASIAKPEAEIEFVRRWIEALRSSDEPRVGELSVLVRPHPYGGTIWNTVRLADSGDAVVWPSPGGNPVDEGFRADYFDSLHHAAAVVGINTSAMIEAAILDRPVLTVVDPAFADTQAGTLHFRHLLPQNGGFLFVASSLPEHAVQLGEALHNQRASSETLRRFVSSFVRPHGRDAPATPKFVETIEEAALLERAPAKLGPARAVLRAALWLFSAVRQIGDRGLLSKWVFRIAVRNGPNVDRRLLALQAVTLVQSGRVLTAERLMGRRGRGVGLRVRVLAGLDVPFVRGPARFRAYALWRQRQFKQRQRQFKRISVFLAPSKLAEKPVLEAIGEPGLTIPVEEADAAADDVQPTPSSRELAEVRS